jgi:hypothetical protein
MYKHIQGRTSFLPPLASKQGFEYIRRNFKNKHDLKRAGVKKMSALVYVYTLIVYLPGLKLSEMLDQKIILNVRINVVNIHVYGMNLFLLFPLHRNLILDRNCSSCKQQLFLVFTVFTASPWASNNSPALNLI